MYGVVFKSTKMNSCVKNKQNTAISTDGNQYLKDQHNGQRKVDADSDHFSSDFVPKLDIMNIVMKRHVGGSHEEYSPSKKRKTENDIDNENLNCFTENLVKDENKTSVSEGDPDMFEKEITDDDVNINQKFTSSPQYNHDNSSDIKHSKSKRGTESEDDELNRSENNPHNRSDNIIPKHISSTNRSENDPHNRSDNIIPKHIISANRSKLAHSSCDGDFINESADVNHTISKDFAANKDNPDKCSNSLSTEIRLKIPPTVYRNKKHSVDSIRNVGEGEGHHVGKDETDGDATSDKDNLEEGEVGSRYFMSHSNHVSKKSRKQTIPKKINKPCIDKVTVNRTEIDTETFIANQELENELISHNKANNSLLSSFNRGTKTVENPESHNRLKDKSQFIHEKSRKQSTPKRKFDNIRVIGDNPEEQESLNDIYSSLEQKHAKCRKQNIPRKIIQGSNTDSSGSSTSIVYQDHDTYSNIDNYEDVNHSSSDNLKESLTSNHNIDDTYDPEHNDDHIRSQYFPNLDLEKPEIFMTPELVRLSQQIALQAELLAKLSQGETQLPDNFNSDNNAAAREGLEFATNASPRGGLEFVKKLREIRVNRYRKISVDMKKHVAGFAKIHGISAAANHFGVSKSAVSLWNRTDFTMKDEEIERRKRNCFIGNEKFENLVQRVKLQKATKFKHLSREDKVEVAKYAKLVGVREMSRCLNMALGTVSGWMRQFPYDIGAKPENASVEVRKCTGELRNNQIYNDVKSAPQNSTTVNNTKCKVNDNIPDEPESTVNIPRHNRDDVSEDCPSLKLEESSKLDTQQVASFLVRDKAIDSCDNERLTTDKKEKKTKGVHMPESSENMDCKLLQSSGKAEHNHEHNNGESANKLNQHVDVSEGPDLETLIASSFAKPDLDKCYAEVKEQITGTVLEDDAYFEHLFKRVTATRVDKYKSLKRSEKLEIVRYAKRIGVRRVAKIMDLATGTLSGWIIKYQHLLGLVSNENADNNLDSSNHSCIELDTGNVSVSVEPEIMKNADTEEEHVNHLLKSPSSILDNKDTTEVTALKFLLKERFPLLQDKISVARKVKFKNLNIGEKLELVKCAKLVGIRPTARVFEMPLGTLSGWISKYSCFLEPEFQGVSQGTASSPSSNTWLINHLDNSLGRLNESEITINTPLITAPHLQWTIPECRSDETQRSDESERSESPYSKMMNEMAEKSFSKISHIIPSNYSADFINNKTNILNRRLNIDWPKLSSQQESDSNPEMLRSKLKLLNEQTEDTSVSSERFSLHGYNGSFDDETTKTMAQQYLRQLELVQGSRL